MCKMCPSGQIMVSFSSKIHKLHTSPYPPYMNITTSKPPWSHQAHALFTLQCDSSSVCAAEGYFLWRGLRRRS